MEYKEALFTICCEPDLLQTARDLVADAAGEAGFEAFEDTDNGLKGYVQPQLLDRDLLDHSLKEFPLDGVSVTYTLNDVESKDWNETWETAGFEPIDIKGKVRIVCASQSDLRHQELPSESLASPTPLLIKIAARQAFGTGTHATTRLMVSALLGIDLSGKRVLDCGCGTGILGIVASKLGAYDVAAYDIDEWSVENTQLNARLNGVENLRVLQGDANALSHISGLFDVVMANINRNVLLADLAAFKDVSAAEGTIILSGFFTTDVPMLTERAKALGLKAASQANDGEWCCLVLQEN